MQPTFKKVAVFIGYQLKFNKNDLNGRLTKYIYKTKNHQPKLMVFNKNFVFLIMASSKETNYYNYQRLLMVNSNRIWH